jgi:hypothetical protein
MSSRPSAENEALLRLGPENPRGPQLSYAKAAQRFILWLALSGIAIVTKSGSFKIPQVGSSLNPPLQISAAARWTTDGGLTLERVEDVNQESGEEE